VKSLRWFVLAALFFVPPASEALGSGDQACCGSLGNAGPWGGGTHFSLCVRAASCSASSHTQVAVTYFDGAPSCPSGSYDCAVTANIECCTYSCAGSPDCSASSPSPSCCSGYCGGGSATPNAACGSSVEARGCCLPNEIRVPSSLRTAPAEWVVGYGYKVK
jgi:hypothetical protein